MNIVNKKAFFDYEILERIAAGLVLTGSEVKSIRGNQITLGESYVKIIDGELWLWNANISKYRFNSDENYDPIRNRKLLVKREEIERMQSKMKQGRLTLVPLKIFQTRGKIKLEIGLARGKKVYEKKIREKERDLERELHRERRKYVL